MSLSWNKKPLSLLLASSLIASTILTSTPTFGASVGSLTIVDPNNATYIPAESEPEEGREPALFPDIEDHWAEEVITTMVGMGLFSGIDEETFAPDQQMTRAEFLTVVIRSMYPTIDETNTTGDYWYSPFFTIAYAEGILPSTWREKYLDEPISRQEIAFVISKSLNPELEQHVNSNTIPDYSTITKSATDDYRGAVLDVYSLGIMAGKTEDGSFFPQEYGTRAECAVVLLNFVDVAYRAEVEFEPDPDALTDLNRLDIDFTRKRDNLTYSLADPMRPIAKVGDTVIIGTEEVKVGTHPSGAAVNGMYIPYIEGVALDLGIDTNSVHGVVTHNFTGGGVHYSGESYFVNPVTGEGYWQSQWDAILKKQSSPTRVGEEEGALSDNQQWNWSVGQHKWIVAYLYEPPVE